MRRALLALTIVLALPGTVSAATPWVGGQPVSGSTPAALFGIRTPAVDFAINASGAAAAAWVDGAGAVRVSRRPPAAPWSPSVIASTAGTNAQGSIAVGIDAAGDVTVVWSSATAFFASEAPAGMPFAPAQLLRDGFSNLQTPTIDLAVNASGAAVAIYQDSQGTQLYASTASTPGGTVDGPTPISGTGGSRSPAVAINAAGQAVVSYTGVDSPGGTPQYKAMASFKPASGAFSPPAAAFLGTSQFFRPRPAIDSTGRVSLLYRTDGNAINVSRRRPENDNFDALATGDGLFSNCGADNDIGGAIAVDATDAVTVAVRCGSSISAASRPAGSGAFAPATSIGGTLTATTPRVELYETPDGHQLATIVEDQTVRAYRRASSATPFGLAETLVDPDDNLALFGAGLDDAADAIALTGQPSAGSNSPVNITSSILDLHPGTAAIAGPDTGVTGQLLTYTFAGTDPFGGFLLPSWTSSDGGAATATSSFDRTFIAAGTYKISVSAKDVGGFATDASKTVVVATPTPAATSTPVPTTTPGSTAAPSPSPGPTASPSPTAGPQPVRCVVPRLKGKTVARARRALRTAHCKLGKVRKPKRHTRKISKQAVKATTVLPAGSTVKVTLTRRRR